jgi:hypothetical protein
MFSNKCFIVFLTAAFILVGYVDRDELFLANKELAFPTELDGYRSEMEPIAQDLTRFIDTANAPIFGIGTKGRVNQWKQQAEKITDLHISPTPHSSFERRLLVINHRLQLQQFFDNTLDKSEPECQKLSVAMNSVTQNMPRTEAPA